MSAGTKQQSDAELVKRLRFIAESPDYWRIANDLHEAADILERAQVQTQADTDLLNLHGETIDSLTRELVALREALDWYADHKRDDSSYDGALFGDLNERAKEETATKKGEPPQGLPQLTG